MSEKAGLNFKSVQVLITAVIGILVFILVSRNLGTLGEMLVESSLMNGIQGFSIIFMSIILEAMPFVMLGAFVASIIQIFVSEQTITKLIPKNKFLGLLIASLMGFVFPVCECAIVPIMRRLLKKGVPLHIGVTFMLAVPIANPVVLLSTYYAFAGDMKMVLLRGVLGMTGAILVGYIIGQLQKGENPLKEDVKDVEGGHDHENMTMKKEGVVDSNSFQFNVVNTHNHDHEHDESCGCGHDHAYDSDSSVKDKIIQVLSHTSAELYSVGRFLILGAFLSALMQTLVSRDLISSIGQGGILSTMVMMGLAFVLSLCSEADAFIARTFLGQFTSGSIVGFMIYGPMIDIKNTMMLAGYFKSKFVIRLIAAITVVCFVLASLVNVFGL